MRQNFLNKFYGPGSDVAGAAASASPVGLALAGAQAGFGIVQSIASDNKIKKLLAQRKAYKTPEEYFQILQATQSMAQQGYDPVTLNYLTDQTDRAFSSGLSTATRLGANPNDLSALFDQKMQGIMKIGAENAQLNMANFSKYLSALDVIGQNKAAEWSSEQDILKDKIQAASQDKAAGVQNVGSAANAFISMDSAAKTSDLYSELLKNMKQGSKLGSLGSMVGRG